MLALPIRITCSALLLLFLKLNYLVFIVSYFNYYSALEHLCRYEEVIQACTLDVDISTMIGGDMSHIGEKGLNLSGGQRARLALARSY